MPDDPTQDAALREKVAKMRHATARMVEEVQHSRGIDQRWLAIAKTDLQRGYMAIDRAIDNDGDF